MVNAVLVVVTFNLYLFWAKSNVRRYLWRTTWLGGTPLAYTGKGSELALGLVLGCASFALVLGVPLVVITGAIAGELQRFDIDLLRATGNAVIDVLLLLVIPVSMSVLALVLALTPRLEASLPIVALCVVVVVIGWFYALSVSRHLSIRYLLRHTAWREARGDVTSSPWRYGRELWWPELSRWLALGWTGPWRYVRRWDRLFNAASFGAESFSFEASSSLLYPRFAAVWFTVAGIVAGLSVLTVDGPYAGLAVSAAVAAAFIAVVLVVAYYNELVYRHVARSLTLGRVRFRFVGTWRGLARLYLVNLLMNLLSMGLAYYYTRMRIAKFVVANLEVEGEPAVGDAPGSEDRPRRGERFGEGLEALVAASYL